jgi:hypothetical protein
MRIDKMRLISLWLALLLLAGCNAKSSDPWKLTPVSGVVTLDGKPLSGATVVFVPTGTTSGVGARGRTDATGTYKLKTRFGGEGTPAGEYRVVVAKLVMPDGSDFSGSSIVPPATSQAKQVLPAQYSTLEATVLKAKIGDSASIIDFPLSAQP